MKRTVELRIIHRIIDMGVLDEKDIDLITNEDLDWIGSIRNVNAYILNILEDDETFRLGAFRNDTNSGKSSDESVRSILKAYPYFYPDKKYRNDMPNSTINYTDDDMKLPFLIRHRVDKFRMSNKLKKYVKELENSSTSHAFFRKMHRDGYL